MQGLRRVHLQLQHLGRHHRRVYGSGAKDDADFDLRNPRDGGVWKTVRARDLFAKIVQYAHHNGEPGALFIDAANRSNPVPHLYDLEATNPCGEQWLGPYENCCLGSINLGMHTALDANGAPCVDWEALRRTVRESTHFLDNVVSANAYVPVVPEVAEAAFRARRIGLGIMGLGRHDVQAGHPLRQRGRAGIRRPGDGVCALPRHGQEH